MKNEKEERKGSEAKIFKRRVPLSCCFSELILSSEGGN